jgi:hypothetical protein
MNRADWIATLRAAWDDADAVAQDLLRPYQDRELGPVHHRRLYGPAADTIERLLAEPPDDGAPTDPDATPTEPGELDADEPPWTPGGGS